MPIGTKKYFWIALLFIFFINTIVFYPSFYHNARADQLVFLIETADLEGWGENIGYSYSYCRNRLLLIGDKLLFRPLFYMHLSLQKELFGYHFIPWQVTGFLYHLVLIGLLLRLFLLIRPHIIAGVWVGAFSLLLIIAEMVIWHHISGYLLFLIFLLLAMGEYVLYLREGKDKHLGWMAFYLTPAIFIYEFGVISCVIMTIMLLLKNISKTKEEGPLSSTGWQRFKPAVLLLPLLAYMYINILDYSYRFAGKETGGGLDFILSGESLMLFFKSLMTMLGMGVTMPFLPYFGMLFSMPRTAFLLITREQLLTMPQMPLLLRLNIIYVIIVLGVAFFIIVQGWRQRRQMRQKMRHLSPGVKQDRHLFILSLLLTMGYILMMVLGRTSQEGRADYMTNSLYHFYPICLFLTIAGYAVFAVFDEWWEDKKAIVLCVIIVMVLGGAINGARVYEFNQFAAKKSAPWSKFFKAVYAFVEEKKDEEDFSFRFLFRDKFSIMQLRIGDPHTGKPIDSSTTDLLLRKYMIPQPTKYYLVYKEDMGLKVFTDKEAGEAFVATITEEPTNL